MAATSLPPNGPVLALDWGAHTAGIAVSPDGRHCFPRDAIAFQSEQELLRALEKIIVQDTISHVVIGLPLTMHGEERDMAMRVRSFGLKLASATDIRVSYEDERLSSQFAQQKQREGSRTVSDSLAALAILENFIAKR